MAKIVGSIVEAINPKLIVELGAFEGKTTAVLSASAPGARILAVEHDQVRADQVHQLGLPNVTVVQNDAIAFLEELKTQTTQMVDFAFVDDDHTMPHVEQELQLLFKVMAPGGIIAMHDVVGGFQLGPLCHKYGGIILHTPLLHPAGGLGLISFSNDLHTNHLGQNTRVIRTNL